MNRPQKHRQRWPGLVVALVCLTVIVLLVRLLPVFQLNRIEATTLRSISETDAVAASGLTIGQHLFEGLGGSLTQLVQLRYAAVEAKLLAAFPTIKTVTASLDFPGKIILAITERIEVAYIEIPDGCVMIDKEGVALKILNITPKDIPVISGVTVTSLNLGQPLAVDVPPSMNSAITLMGAIIDADKDDRPVTLLLPQLRKIMPVGGHRLYLTVILPNTGEELSVAAETGSDQADDMLWLRFALAQGVFDSRGKGVLDLTGSRRTFTPD
jgi:hypothetical protein